MKSTASLCFMALLMTNIAHAQYANQVVSYNPGSTPYVNYLGSYTTAATALGAPERITGEMGGFPDVVTIFNPAWGPDEIVSIGEGGHLTLRLSNFVLPDPTGPEIGVFESVFLVDNDFNNVVDVPASSVGGDSAKVEVSEDGIFWVTLGTFNFNLPAQAFTDQAGTIPSNFQQPFTGVVGDFDGLPFSDPVDFDVFDLLAGSGGGNWIDISSSGLAKVGYIRFSVADDLDPNTSLNFELDAVSISAAAMGNVVPEPTTLALLSLASLGLLRRR